jgi:hypothetical protein
VKINLSAPRTPNLEHNHNPIAHAAPLEKALFLLAQMWDTLKCKVHASSQVQRWKSMSLGGVQRSCSDVGWTLVFRLANLSAPRTELLWWVGRFLWPGSVCTRVLVLAGLVRMHACGVEQQMQGSKRLGNGQVAFEVSPLTLIFG